MTSGDPFAFDGEPIIDADAVAESELRDMVGGVIGYLTRVGEVNELALIDALAANRITLVSDPDRRSNRLATKMGDEWRAALRARR